ncbi:hypothetical protein AB4Z32_14775 [Massilia sp. 2TAF26]|uniref:hypothetical protein n=1 Tax=Massilia sp. 2TAF26 TaxID=3233012 RepID=UPI003F995AEC
MPYPDYESSAEAEVSKALRHDALKARLHRRRPSKALIAAAAAGALLPRWLDLPPVSASIVSGLLAAAIFMLVERLIRRQR